MVARLVPRKGQRSQLTNGGPRAVCNEASPQLVTQHPFLACTPCRQLDVIVYYVLPLMPRETTARCEIDGKSHVLEVTKRALLVSRCWNALVTPN